MLLVIFFLLDIVIYYWIASFNMSPRAQGAIEYLLIIGAAILVVAIVILVRW